MNKYRDDLIQRKENCKEQTVADEKQKEAVEQNAIIEKQNDDNGLDAYIDALISIMGNAENVNWGEVPLNHKRDFTCAVLKTIRDSAENEIKKAENAKFVDATKTIKKPPKFDDGPTEEIKEE